MTNERIIRAIDLCCGAGGWACAARGLPVEIVHAFDLWPEAAKTYEINHPKTTVHIADLSSAAAVREVLKICGPHVDLVLGGIPCEAISVFRNGWNPQTKVGETEIAGWQKLLDNCLRVVKVLRPRWWSLEDVAGIIGHLPPMTPWVEINSVEYGAQRRRRVYVGEFPAPQRGASAEFMGDHLCAGPYRVGTRLWPRGPAASNVFDGAHFYGAAADRKSPTICDFGSRRDAELGVLDPRLPGGKRQMEWQEAARLQGFPEDYLFYGCPTAVWKMIGQAIQIDTGRAILQAIVAESDQA